VDIELENKKIRLKKKANKQINDIKISDILPSYGVSNGPTIKE
jgi:hypothetical protein